LREGEAGAGEGFKKKENKNKHNIYCSVLKVGFQDFIIWYRKCTKHGGSGVASFYEHFKICR
jgi:hypothetical protein